MPPFDPQSLRFVSALPGECRPALQRLVFAHPRQGRMRLSILDNIHTHGVPRIVGPDGFLRVVVAKIPDAQNLFAVVQKTDRTQLLGFVLYTRDNEWLDILFLSVRHACTEERRLAHMGVTYRIMDELNRIARHLKGCAGVRLEYRAGAPLFIPVHLAP